MLVCMAVYLFHACCTWCLPGARSIHRLRAVVAHTTFEQQSGNIGCSSSLVAVKVGSRGGPPLVARSKGAEVEKDGSGNVLDTDRVGNKQAAVGDPSKFAAIVLVPTAPCLPDWAVERSARKGTCQLCKFMHVSACISLLSQNHLKTVHYQSAWAVGIPETEADKGSETDSTLLTAEACETLPYDPLPPLYKAACVRRFRTLGLDEALLLIAGHCPLAGQLVSSNVDHGGPWCSRHLD